MRKRRRLGAALMMTPCATTNRLLLWRRCKGPSQIKRRHDGTFEAGSGLGWFRSIAGDDNEWSDLSHRLDRCDHVHSFLLGTSLMAPRTLADPVRPMTPELAVPAARYLHWGPIIAGAIVAAAVSFVLISFGSGIGLAVASPSSSWRDTSSVLALLGGLWLLLTSLAAFGLGGYLAGRLRESWSDSTPDALEFRDGIHG